MAKDSPTILTREEIDDGKAPAHTSCMPLERDGKTVYVYSGKTGKAARQSAKKS